MRKFIKGKCYNTIVDTYIATFKGGIYEDFRDERLYQTSEGTFYLIGFGGKRTRWDHVCPAYHLGELESIIIIDETQARAWVEMYANYMYRELFLKKASA